MKTDISIPNPVYKAAKQLAETLGISLNDLYTAAVTTYVTSHQNGGVTEALNRVYDKESSAIDPTLVRVQITSLGDDRW